VECGFEKGGWRSGLNRGVRVRDRRWETRGREMDRGWG